MQAVHVAPDAPLALCTRNPAAGPDRSSTSSPFAARESEVLNDDVLPSGRRTLGRTLRSTAFHARRARAYSSQRRRSESNRRIADLQSAALPLGHGAEPQT